MTPTDADLFDIPVDESLLAAAEAAAQLREGELARKRAERIARRRGLSMRAIEELATEALLIEAHLATNDPARFFEFVVREETSLRPLIITPHQRVLFSFVWHHKRCVVRMPVGSSKTFCMGGMSMFLLGQDQTQRGAIISSTQAQASKVVSMVADYVEQPELNVALRMVFPNLRKTQRAQDPWTQTKITVDRPAGIRDPSLVAVGTDGALPGARLSWVLVDDILSRQNTATPDAREQVHEFFDSTVLSRLDPDARLVVTNTPWHPDDLTYRLEEAGWPTITMDVMGGITIANAADDWDTDDIRPGREAGECYRLAEHDPDAAESKVLWELKFSLDKIQELRDRHMQHRFNQLFMCQCRDDARANCKQEWIDRCLGHGRAWRNEDGSQGSRLTSRYLGGNMTVTGVDLAVGQEKRHDQTAFVTLELLPSGKRRILDIDVGRWDGPTIVKKIIAKQRAYNSIVRVENNAAQDYIRQFTLAANASVPVKAHTTGKNKADPTFGVESIFVELSNGAWVLPCPARGKPHKNVQKLIDGWLYFDPSPRKHTDDLVMAAWLAREQARALGDGLLLPAANSSGVRSIMSR